jgi:hypothetical protein
VKAALAIVVVVLGSLLPVTSSGAGGRTRCSAVPRHAARLTIKALKILDRPIRTNPCGTAYGTVWDFGHPARPGDGEAMLIDAHDVTPVPGYDTHGAHGPFYHLSRIKPGYRMKIRWHGVVWRYRFVGHPFARRQCLSKRVNDLPAHLSGELLCVANDKPIKNVGGETVYFRCCWPRYHIRQFLYVRAVLVKPATSP